MLSVREKIGEALAAIRKRAAFQAEIGMILGSGLGEMANEITPTAIIPFKDIPHMPVSTVPGHEGALVLGELEGKKVAALKGRIHYYEGYSMTEVTFPVRVLKALGCQVLIVTNACGGINREFRPGDLMVITDHINLMGDNPLIGPNDDALGPRFPDMSKAYDPDFVNLAFRTADAIGLQLKAGVFCAVSGPTYETMAEIRQIEIMGGDAVGMSTVPEVIVATHAGLRILGISCVTDVVFSGQGVTHEEVLAVAEQTKPKFKALVRALVKAIKLVQHAGR